MTILQANYSGATAPDFHRLLRFISKTDLTLCLFIIRCQDLTTGKGNRVTARITLIAHGATEAQRNTAFPQDESITERETARIAALNWSTPRAEEVWSAPEKRTQQTSQGLRLAAIVTKELRDCDYGKWRGRRIEELQSENPEGILTWLTDPTASPHEGESVEELISRVGYWMDKQRSVRHTIAVTHPAVIRSAIVYGLGIPAQTFWRFDVAPLTLTDLTFSGDVWTLRCVGCALQTQK